MDTDKHRNVILNEVKNLCFLDSSGFALRMTAKLSTVKICVNLW